MNWIKNRYNLIFTGFIASIIVLFALFRPINSPWNKIIGGDGLGYYSYLPATFIYNDQAYEFKWFNKVYEANYAESSSKIPDENFLVPYGNHKINKYYQGLSFLWLPFFAVGHLSAKLLNYPADGFSAPYQFFIGMASLCYLFLGLCYLRKLLRKLFQHELVATITPIAVFYGTYLFHYSIFLNSHSHVYSFTFITLFIYYTVSFFNDPNQKETSLLLSLLCLMMIVCIRPLNGLIILIIPAFMPTGFFKQKFAFRFKRKHGFMLLGIGIILLYELRILYIQTASFFPYTYTSERFYLFHPKLFDVLFSYHAGLFIYVPLAFVSLFGIYFLKTTRQKIILPILLFLVLYIYSSWWYWPITSRTLIDYYPVLAIFLAALFYQMTISRYLNNFFLMLLTGLVGYHQLKNFQLRHGILDENYTYAAFFWKNFFTIHESNNYAIPPSSITNHVDFSENFETDSYTGYKSDAVKHTGSYAAQLDIQHPYSSLFKYKVPAFFSKQGVKKIRFSFWTYFQKDLDAMTLYFHFFDKQGVAVKEVPFYINKNVIRYDRWDYREFGYELTDNELTALSPDQLQIFLWDHKTKNKLYLDDVKLEFIMTDKSYEIIQ